MATHRINLHALAVSATMLLTVPGCLEREETITITPAGAVTIELEYTGSPQNFRTPDALPSERSGWRITRTSEIDGEGKEEVTITSRRRFEPREELPGTYAAGNDPDVDLYLSFPTTLRHERRADGVYLHFRRVYMPRRWAYVDFWRGLFMDDRMEQLGEKPVDEMSPEEKLEIVKAFAGLELFKRVEFASSALKQCDPDLRPDAWLRARAAMLEVGEDANLDEIVALIGDLPDDQRDVEFERETERLLDEALEAFVDELEDVAAYDATQVERFQKAYERAEKYFAVTDSLGAHVFGIRVKMPGEVVAHNADKIDDDGLAVWEFDGEAFRDRPCELMITSKLSGKQTDR